MTPEARRPSRQGEPSALQGATIAAVIIGTVTLFYSFPVATIVWAIVAVAYQLVENDVVSPVVYPAHGAGPRDGGDPRRTDRRDAAGSGRRPARNPGGRGDPILVRDAHRERTNAAEALT